MIIFINRRNLPSGICDAQRKKPFVAALCTALAGILCVPTGGQAASNVPPPSHQIKGDSSVEAPPSSAENAEQAPPASTKTPADAAPLRTVFIKEIRVQGAHLLPPEEVQDTVYPFLGPGRTAEDVESARLALEKAYQAKGYQAAQVLIPPQNATHGIVILQVNEGIVGRLRIHGSRYFSPSEIRKEAPSLAEGKVVNFNDVTRDVVALNQFPDRRVTPTLKAGVTPGTVDIDLNVKDTLPLHGNLELNNRYSPNTTELRLNGSISYDNLWQLGHTIGASFQIAPERLQDAEVFSGYYLAPVPNVSWLSLMVQGTKQNSNVSTLGSNSVGKGYTIGGRAIITLPPGKEFYQSISLGVDYKNLEQNVTTVGADSLNGNLIQSPDEYYPFSALYSGNWTNKGATTDVSAGVTFSFRGTGTGAPNTSPVPVQNPTAFDANRYAADDNFIYLKGSISHTHDLPANAQIYGQVQGQLANEPLVNSEQFSGGGLDTVRGYLESTVLGDNAVVGSLELRTPSLIGPPDGVKKTGEASDNEWRFYVFLDGGILTLRNPLPEQTSEFDLASYGVGSRIKISEHFNGSIDLGVPLIGQSPVSPHDLLCTFRIWAEF